jgi:hypothetical protein
MLAIAASNSSMPTRGTAPRPSRPDCLAAHAEPSRDGRELPADRDRCAPLENGEDRVADHAEGRVNSGTDFEGEELRCQSITVHVCGRNEDECLEPDRESCVSADLERGTPRA